MLANTASPLYHRPVGIVRQERLWESMNNKQLTTLVILPVLIIGLGVGTMVIWKPGPPLKNPDPAPRSPQEAAAPTIAKQQDSQPAPDVTLSPEAIEEINRFVSGDSSETLERELPGGGHQVDLNGGYRHGVILQRDESGNLRKIEVGPDGVPEKHRN